MSSTAEPQAQSYFLSYSRSDERFALRLAKDLRAHGVGIWVDQLDIRPSEHWDRAIERAVQQCQGIIVVLSPRSAASDNVADEISYAIDSGKSVLPVMIERCTLPLRITRMQVVDATAKYEQALQHCLDELRRRNDAPAPEAALPLLALDPEGIASATERLATIVGPIAKVLAEKACAQSTSMKEFYVRVAEHIERQNDRERFLAYFSVGPAIAPTERSANEPSNPTGSKCSIAQNEIEKLGQILIKYLGPIAPRVVQRESRASATLEDLRGTLALLISDQKERAEFLRQAEDR